MGLSANQARVLLLTSKNDAYELQAQLISNERLILAQEQERISNEYSDKTSDEVWVCDVADSEKESGKTERTMTLQTLGAAFAGETIYIKYGDKYIGVKVPLSDSGMPDWDKTEYFETNNMDDKGNATSVTSQGRSADSNGIKSEVAKFNNIIQTMARNNTLVILMENSDDTNTSGNTQAGSVTIGGKKYTKKDPASLTGVRSRYYTENDAPSEAEYNTAMARVNQIDKRLENKLNQIETQKKAVETELESAKNLVKTNEERTFKYMS